MMSPHLQNSNHIAPPSIAPSTPGPMTPMTPASADPAILPQLQLVKTLIYNEKYLVCSICVTGILFLQLI